MGQETGKGSTEVVGMNAVSDALARNRPGIYPTWDRSTKGRDADTSAARTDTITIVVAFALYLSLVCSPRSVRTNPLWSHD
jgi:hypothetical protein